MPINDEARSAIMRFCDRHYIQYKRGWENFTRNVVLPGAITIDIESIQHLQKLVRYINELNKTSPDKINVRIVAGGKTQENKTEKKYSKSFSLTPCMEGDVIVRLTGSEFQIIEMIDKKEKLVRVGASVQIGELDQKLYHNFGLSLPTSSLIPWPTLAGLTANGGHGTGRDQPAVSGLIKAMTILRPDGKIVRIDASHPDFETIRSCHLGLFGIVLSLEVSCITAKKLKCTINACNIHEFKEEVKNGLYQKNKYVSVIYIPTYRQDEKEASCPPNVRIITWEPVPMHVENTGSCVELQHAGEELGIVLNESFQITDLLAKYPELIPSFMRYFVSTTEIGRKDSTIIGDFPDVAHYRHAYPHKLEDDDQQFNTSPDCHEIIQAMDHAVDTLDKFAKQNQYPVVYAIYLRYFKGTTGGLSPSFSKEDQHVCGFDITSAPNIPGWLEFKKEIQSFMIDKLHSRPHWGKTVPLETEYADIYGEKFIEFKAALERWYQNCGMKFEDSQFLNPFFNDILNIQSLKSLAQEKTEPPTTWTACHHIAKQALKVMKKRDADFDKNHSAKILESELKTTMQYELMKVTPSTYTSFPPKKETSEKSPKKSKRYSFLS